MKLAPARFRVSGVRRPFIVDKWLLAQIVKYNWRYVPRTKTLRATVTARKPRMFLHQFICKLAHRDWEEIYFANGDTHDCRLVNLKPYDRLLQATLRRKGKNNKSGHPGVSFNDAKKKWQAVIRHKGKLHHIGYYSTPSIAAKAYRDEFRILKGVPFVNKKV